MILIDSNVFMYAVGTAHEKKDPSIRFLRQVASGSIAGAIDAEVLQEILHRYRSIRRWQDGNEVFDLATTTVSEIFPVTSAVMDGARNLMNSDPQLSARDAVHAAVAIEYGIRTIASFDADFDRIEGLRRIIP